MNFTTEWEKNTQIVLPKDLKTLRDKYLSITADNVLSATKINGIANHMSVFETAPTSFPKREEPEANHFTLGRHIHLVVETEGDALNDFVVDRKDLLDDLTATELKVVREGCNINSYCKYYKNADTRAAMEGEESAIEKILRCISEIEKKYQKYEEFLENNYGKFIVSDKDYKIIQSCYHSVLKNEEASRLLLDSFINPLNDPNIITYAELPTFYNKVISINDNPLYEIVESIPMKSLKDRVIVDKRNKIIKLIDTKTTHDSPNRFIYSYKKYGYWRQLAVYKEALTMLLLKQDDLRMVDFGDIDLGEYHWEYYIVCISTGYAVTKVFRISPVDIEAGTNNGTLKPTGSLYNELGEIQIFLDPKTKANLKQLGILNTHNPDLDADGFNEVIRKMVKQKYSNL